MCLGRWSRQISGMAVVRYCRQRRSFKFMANFREFMAVFRYCRQKPGIWDDEKPWQRQRQSGKAPDRVLSPVWATEQLLGLQRQEDRLARVVLRV